MILEGILKFSLFFKCLREFGVHVNIGDTAVLKGDTEILEFSGEILHHFGGHFSLEVKNLTQPDAVDEGTDAFVYLSVEELVETTRTQLVHEIHHFLMVLRHSEGEEEVDVDVRIIFRWAIVDWGIVINYSFS